MNRLLIIILKLRVDFTSIMSFCWKLNKLRIFFLRWGDYEVEFVDSDDFMIEFVDNLWYYWH